MWAAATFNVAACCKLDVFPPLSRTPPPAPVRLMLDGFELFRYRFKSVLSVDSGSRNSLAKCSSYLHNIHVNTKGKRRYHHLSLCYEMGCKSKESNASLRSIQRKPIYPSLTEVKSAK
jgi:hypothetical protein